MLATQVGLLSKWTDVVDLIWASDEWLAEHVELDSMNAAPKLCVQGLWPSNSTTALELKKPAY